MNSPVVEDQIMLDGESCHTALMNAAVWSIWTHGITCAELLLFCLPGNLHAWLSYLLSAGSRLMVDRGRTISFRDRSLQMLKESRMNDISRFLISSVYVRTGHKRLCGAVMFYCILE